MDFTYLGYFSSVAGVNGKLYLTGYLGSEKS
jgi:hypothetical protein